MATSRRVRQMSKTNPGGGKIAHPTRPPNANGNYFEMLFTQNQAATFDLSVLFPNYTVAGAESAGLAAPNFAITTLPTGMSLDGTTGIVSGTPTTPGSGTPGLTFRDKYGLSREINGIWNVAPA